MAEKEASPSFSDTYAGTATLQIASLQKYESFYTPLEERFERISRLGTRALGAQAAGVTLVVDETLWFKSLVGWRVSELPLKASFCQHVLQSGEPLIVLDALEDPRFAKSPLVTGGPKFRFYAGYPIRDTNEQVIGTFCAYDLKPKKAGEWLSETLSDLGQLAERELLTSDLWDAQGQLLSKLGTARRQALLDTLTRVWNRRGAMELIKFVLEESNNSGEKIAVCMADIDFFKQINDQYGHAAGDLTLRKIAATIVATVRPDDMVARYGGDEFIIVLRDAPPDMYRSIADRIRTCVEKTRVRTRDGSINATVSIGVAINDPSEAPGAKQLIEWADQALYHTKQNGRNGTTLWPDDIS